MSQCHWLLKLQPDPFPYSRWGGHRQWPPSHTALGTGHSHSPRRSAALPHSLMGPEIGTRQQGMLVGSRVGSSLPVILSLHFFSPKINLAFNPTYRKVSACRQGAHVPPSPFSMSPQPSSDSPKHQYPLPAPAEPPPYGKHTPSHLHHLSAMGRTSS